MKKNIILSALLALTMIFCMAASVSAASDAKMTAIYGTPKIDGELDDIWKNAEVQDVALVDEAVIPSETETRGTVRTMWDEKYFYVFIEVDKKGVPISAGGGKNENSDDCADVCLTLDGNFSASVNGGDEYSGVYRVIEDGTYSGFGYIHDYLGDDNLGAFKRVADDKYNVEYAISWDDIEAKAGNIVSLEIQINDCTDGARTGLVTWASTPCYGWRESNEHGTVTLGAKDGSAPAAAEEIAPDYIDYTATDVAVSTGAFNTLDEAAASVELNPIKGYTFISGTESVGEKEPPEALWDDDVTTKFCVADTTQFPTISVAKLSAPAKVSGIAFATANDNAKNPGRNPFEWAVFVSADGQNWTQLVYGDDTFLEDVDFTYYATKTQTVDNVQYVKFQSEGGLSGVFQMSEVVLLGETTAAPAEETKPETPADTVETPVETPDETVETPVEEAPQTFDAVVIAAVTAVVSLAGYAVSKKR